MRENALQQRVSRLRELIKDASDRPADTLPAMPVDESDAWKRFNAFVQNDPLPCSDISEGAIAMREINRIAISYGWTREIQRFLDRERVSSLSALDETQLQELHERMTTLEDCAQHGCDSPDAPAAR
ncbi:MULTISPECIES: hypothetical protein [Luteimonas]|uniref:hypothetical protein n=1 Tax=Luteimonas TaxID=83614 RepID=UPI000C7AF3B0|nr:MULTISPECIES: hypothetical protein [Luteimonas]